MDNNMHGVNYTVMNLGRPLPSSCCTEKGQPEDLNLYHNTLELRLIRSTNLVFLPL